VGRKNLNHFIVEEGQASRTKMLGAQIRPVQELTIVANTPGGVLCAVVIPPSCLDVAVVHRSLRQLAFAPTYGRRNETSRGLCLDNGQL
jgi:hypothetical protein